MPKTDQFFDDISFDDEIVDDDPEYYSTATEDNRYFYMSEAEFGCAVKDAIEEYREDIGDIF